MPKLANQDKVHSESHNRTDEIVALIRRKITFQEYLPGDVLPNEETLANRFSVSRACIRESLSILKAQGYLESRRGKHGGTFIKNILESNKIDNLYGDLVLMGQMEIQDLLDARLLIEPVAAREAAIRATPGDVLTLQGYLEQSINATTQDKYIEYQIIFHNAIGQICGNPFYAISIRNFMKFTQLFMQTMGEQSLQMHDSTDHEAILQAISTNKPGLAFEKMYVHNSKTKDTMMVMEQKFRETRTQDMHS